MQSKLRIECVSTRWDMITIKWSSMDRDKAPKPKLETEEEQEPGQEKAYDDTTKTTDSSKLFELKNEVEEEDDEMTVYQVQIRKSGVISFVFAYEGCEKQHGFCDLEPGTTYEFIVRRKIGFELGPWSSVFSQKTAFISPSTLTAQSVGPDSATFSWNGLQAAPGKKAVYQVSMQRGSIRIPGVPRSGGRGSGSREPSIVYNGNETHFTVTTLEPLTHYSFFLRVGCGGNWSRWSTPLDINTPEAPFPGFWREGANYAVEKGSRMVVTKTQASAFIKTSAAIPGCSLISGGVVDWGVKIINSRYMDIYVGVAPCDIYYTDTKEIPIYGWYVHLKTGALYSSAPHKFVGVRYIQKGLVKEGDVVGCQVNVGERSVSFTVNGEEEGVAYNQIFTDIPLVPVVILKYKGDSVGLVSVSSSAPVPSTQPPSSEVVVATKESTPVKEDSSPAEVAKEATTAIHEESSPVVKEEPSPATKEEPSTTTETTSITEITEKPTEKTEEPSTIIEEPSSTTEITEKPTEKTEELSTIIEESSSVATETTEKTEEPSLVSAESTEEIEESTEESPAEVPISE